MGSADDALLGGVVVSSCQETDFDWLDFASLLTVGKSRARIVSSLSTAEREVSTQAHSWRRIARGRQHFVENLKEPPRRTTLGVVVALRPAEKRSRAEDGTRKNASVRRTVLGAERKRFLIIAR
jgi:hypothetical protein